jgi:EAL domain-containing protein (putative c-di-GMP-specific phosphodiesterase class I)
VDRSFVSRINETSGAQMVRTVATLARNLELAVVAEGVETAEQLAALRGAGCDYAQGFYLSPPLEPAALLALAESEPRW